MLRHHNVSRSLTALWMGATLLLATAPPGAGGFAGDGAREVQ